MNEISTEKLDNILKKASLESYEQLITEKNSEDLPSLSDYLNEYIGKKSLVVPEIIKSSLLSRDYAYSILNGNRKNPSRDKIIALCLAMHMNLKEVQRALKLSNAGTLYSKNKRDGAIIIFFNTGEYNIMRLNDFLAKHSLDILHTSKEILNQGIQDT
ncbi:MAG: hypothetical protein MJ131_10315 [Lachnospiraceae bacterium]|nr:hypothetical protein [Lachnospiraceae bacterium]